MSQEWSVLFWAMLGGIIVSFGLVFEKIAEWMDDHFLGGYKAHKKLGEIGWIILMAGILIEVADAGFAAHDAWQTKQLAKRQDPFNQPIASVSAHLSFMQVGTNHSRLDPKNFETRGTWVLLELGNFEQVRNSSNHMFAANLACSSCESTGVETTNTIWFLDFDQGGFNTWRPPVKGNLTVRDAANWDAADLMALFLREGTEIEPFGNLTVVINGFFRKTIPFPKQVVSNPAAGDPRNSLTVHSF